MKNLVFPLLFISCLFVTFFSCSNKPERSRKPVSTITIEPAKRIYSFKEKIDINVKTKVKNGDIKNIQLYFNNKLIKESIELDFYVTGIELNSLGNNSLKVVATKTDNLSNTKSKLVSVVSDLVPQKLTYQIVKNYPHLKTSYTQGLEFFNGFLYEGTGNEGFSKLLKVNLNTGNAEQTYNLDKKYFGEGITILNNKIYQLTYRAQKGFVYDLNTFALIDSFQYKSKQGWGLTNDGKSLIMSDSSHKLIWINPEDYSEIKTVQVANDKGIVNFLNELEYINGSIYANVYTTDLIVQIEPETGKILSEINMSGILNMYKTPKDTVDYLNGIAYDDENDRLFVTGKWWPRLFEIKLTSSK